MDEKKVKEVNATRTIRKALKISDVMLKIFHMAISKNLEWVKQA